MKNKIAYYIEIGVVTPNILARKSEEVSLPYCKTRAESEGNKYCYSIYLQGLKESVKSLVNIASIMANI
jgi:hypothetical protein